MWLCVTFPSFLWGRGMDFWADSGIGFQVQRERLEVKGQSKPGHHPLTSHPNRANPGRGYSAPQHPWFRNKHRLVFQSNQRRAISKRSGATCWEPAWHRMKESLLELGLHVAPRATAPLLPSSPKRANILHGICFVLRSDLQSHNYPGNWGLMLPKISW